MAYESFVENLIKSLEVEPTETEVKAARHMQDFCIQNDLFFPDSVFVLSAFSGFDPNILIEKVNAVNTPVQEEYLNNSF